ncbi:hypothetical protein NP233_g4727 [Leucocoprinus birnbaumii]|uniref:F-box domain-containing protein n=1 Tax=Leucocoprinus birnbaumii TaxID=56174 RepID=A0AAD5W0K3_9AGAR|nr:hypothetical protein NP233_g4727 [Leucocoprinus birnbaumii]
MTHTALPYHLSPISSLPSEILISIFHQGTKEEYQSSISRLPPNPFNHRLSPFTFRVSQVCRVWYEVANSVPTLWSTFADYDTYETEWANRSLQLSRNCLLDVQFSSGLRRRNHSSNVRALRDHSHRLRTLHYTTHSSHVPDDVQALLEQPMPALKALILSYGLGVWKIDDQAVATFPFLFQHHATSLTTLVSYRCYIDLSSTALSRLRILEVHHIPPPYRPSVSAWIEHLRNIPALESLSISHSITSTTSPASDMLELPQLRQLRFTGGISGSGLFSRLVVPRLNEIDFSFDCSILPSPGEITDVVLIEAFSQCLDSQRLCESQVALCLQKGRLSVQTLNLCDGVEPDSSYRLLLELTWNVDQAPNVNVSMAFEAVCQRLNRSKSLAIRIDGPEGSASLPLYFSKLYSSRPSQFLRKVPQDFKQLRRIIFHSPIVMAPLFLDDLLSPVSLWDTADAFPSIEELEFAIPPRHLDEAKWIQDFVHHRRINGKSLPIIFIPRSDNAGELLEGLQFVGTHGGRAEDIFAKQAAASHAVSMFRPRVSNSWALRT